MSVIIRMQNLPWSANALDIREFFKGLSIPEGGVHIVGGELGDAFIAFSTDEDARLAMRMTGTSLKGIQVTLLLSSRTEMQKVIEAARQQAMALHGFVVPAVIPGQPQQPNASPTNPQPGPPQPPQPQQVQPQPQGVPPPSQAPVPPPQMQLPVHSPFPMHSLPPGADGHPPIPPMPPHMPHTPPTTMLQPMQPLPPHLSHIQEAAYNNLSNQLENNNDSQSVPPPGSVMSKDDKREDKKPSSASTALSSSSKRDSKGRDGRRRRTRSRSRSRTRSRSRDRERDRHRRYRSRSKSRSRDRSGRNHRRSRSRERDRFRDKNRDRDRGRDRDRDRERDRSSRGVRDRSDRSSQDSNKALASNDQQNKDVEVIGGTGGGIPGLGEIPSISMRGPLPSSLAEPIRNSPIQTPPGPVPVPTYNPGLPFAGVPPYPQQMPFNKMSVPPPTAPAPPLIDAPTDMELIAEDEGSLDQEGPNEVHPDVPFPEPVVTKPPNEYMGTPIDGQMRGPVGPPPRFGPMPGGMPGPMPVDAPVPQFGNRGPMPMRPNDSFGFEEQGANFPPSAEGGNNFNPEHFDPRNRPESAQRNWDPRSNSPSDMSRFRGEREQRDRGFRGEKEMNRDPGGERDPRENDDMREMREDTEMHGNWNSRNRMGRMEEFGPGWDGPNRQDGPKESTWNGRGRQGNFHPRNEREKYSGRNERDGWHEQENWGGRDGYSNRDKERYGEEGEYEENFGSRGYRGRGGRGWDRSRGWDRGRGSRGGFNPRHGEFMDGHREDGYVPRGGHGGFRGRGASRWGGQFNEETSCVELNNVPVTASYRAIRDIFQNMFVPNNGIKLIGDSHGSRIDVAYIRFSHPRDALRATKFSGNYLYDNIVEITLLSEAKYDSEIDLKQLTGNRGYRGAPPPELEKNFIIESSCVYVTGLPMGCTDHNVAQVFEKFKIEDIVIERVRGTRQPSGGCFVRLQSFEEAQRAIAELADASIDGSPLLVELCPASAMVPAVKDRDLILGVSNDKPPETKKPPPKVEPSSDGPPAEQPVVKQSGASDLLTDSVVLNNVPKDATEANIRDFFSDEGLVPERMHFCEPGTNGVREVYVMFPLIENAKRAVGKNEQQIGKMKVMVEMIAKPVVMSAMGLTFDPLELIKKGQKSGMNAPGNEKISISQVNIPLEEADGIPIEDQDHGMKPDDAMEEPFMGVQHPHGYDGQPPFRGRMAGPYPGGRGFMPRGDMRGMNRMMGGPGRGGMGEFGGRMRGPLLRPPASEAEDNIGTAIPPENFGKPGCVVALGNLPYRCTTDDILDFMRDFPTLRPEHIIRRYNEFNQPTADARVSFSNTQDAQRAMQMHNRRMMDNRLIYISLVQK